MATTSNSRKTNSHKKNILLFLLALIITGTLTGLITSHKTQKRVEAEELALQQAEEQRVTDSIHVSDSLAYHHLISPKWGDTEVQPGEGLFQVVQRFGINQTNFLAIYNKLRFETELSLRVGQKFAVKYTPDSTRIMEFQYIPNRVQTHRILIDTLTDSLSYILDEKATITKFQFIEGELAENSTLSQSLLESGTPSSIANTVGNVLTCKIAFNTDARVHDVFQVLLKEEYYNDTILSGRTKILYASYQGNRAGFTEAYYYQDTIPKSIYTAHYTKDGEALIFSGLRYPLDALRITSNYGYRIHPVTGGKKLHAGIDYAGRVGTKVYAVAPGKVVLSSYDKYSGNKVAIRHSDGYISYYLHLNKRKVSLGQKVISRQIIGTVGKTGRVTGPHLHFGFKKPNGRWMNPSHKRMIATPKLKGRRRELLLQQINIIDSLRANNQPEAITEEIKAEENLTSTGLDTSKELGASVE